MPKQNAEGIYAERLAQQCKGSGFCLTGEEKIFQKKEKKSREKKVQCTRAEAIEGPMPKSTRAHVENAPKEHVYTNSFREGTPRQLLPPAPPVVLITCFTKEWANPFLSTLDCTILLSWIFEERACFAWLLSTQNVPTTEHDCTAGCGLCSRE